MARPNRGVRLKLVLRLSEQEWQCVAEAALDAHMEPAQYCRLMVLCAAGMGGVTEHLQRATDASMDAEEGNVVVVRDGWDDACTELDRLAAEQSGGTPLVLRMAAKTLRKIAQERG